MTIHLRSRMPWMPDIDFTAVAYVDLCHDDGLGVCIRIHRTGHPVELFPAEDYAIFANEE